MARPAIPSTRFRSSDPVMGPVQRRSICTRPSRTPPQTTEPPRITCMHGTNGLPSRIPGQMFPYRHPLVPHHCCLSPPKTPFRLKEQAATFGLAHRHSHGSPYAAPQMIRRPNRLTYAIRILLLNHKQFVPARVYQLLSPSLFSTHRFSDQAPRGPISPPSARQPRSRRT